MFKRFVFLFNLMFVFCGFVFSQVSEEIREELVNLYTSYAQSRTGNERLQYIRNNESFIEIFQSQYGDREISYTPIGFGRANRSVTGLDIEVYYLEETVLVNQGGRAVENIMYRYFVRTNNSFKIDWAASVGYNPITFARFNALQDGQIAIMRCYANLTTSRYDDYFGIDIRDELTNFQFTAYIRKNTEDGLLLMEYLERGNARPAILEMQYIDNLNRYSKQVLITKFVIRGWVQ